ncbi:MAG: antibiotic biosynthesis monooxygenase, partial [Gammaproteobacteria bacterium]|nr:antibiotic biosynthesis monooxygenase [Gammaproteobacteria bacterium]
MRETLGQFGIRGAEVLKYQIDLAEPVYDETGTARADFFTAKAD